MRKNAALLSVWVDLEDAECIAIRIYEIALPAGIRHRELGQSNDATELFDGACGGVEVRDLQRSHECIGTALWWRRLRWALQEATAGAAGRDRPV